MLRPNFLHNYQIDSHSGRWPIHAASFVMSGTFERSSNRASRYAEPCSPMLCCWVRLTLLKSRAEDATALPKAGAKSKDEATCDARSPITACQPPPIRKIPINRSNQTTYPPNQDCRLIPSIQLQLI